MSIRGLIIFAVISLVTSTNTTYVEFSLTSAMTLGWRFVGNSSIELTLKVKSSQCNTIGYCSIGFARTMGNCDMVAVYVQGANLQVLDLWSDSHDTPSEDTLLGGKKDYTVSLTQVENWSNVNGYLTVVLVRQLNTGDKYDTVLSEGLMMEICWGYLHKANGFKEHSSYGNGRIVWGISPTTASYIDQTGKAEGHMVVMSIAWLIAIQLAIIPARYFKALSRWYIIHFIIGWVVILATYVTASDMFVDDQLSQYEQNMMFHSRLGMIMLSILIGEAFLGMITRGFMMFSSNISVIQGARRMHRMVGYSLLILGFATCWYGSLSSAPTLPVVEIIAYIVWGIILGLIELIYRLGPKKLRCLTMCCRKRAIMTHIEVLDAVQNEKKPWAFLDQYVLNMAHFTNPHPGGAFLIKETYGEDYGKYFSGTNGFGAITSGYTHSEKARLYMKWCIIGKLPAQEDFFQGDNPGYKWMAWDLYDSREVANNTNVLSFTHASLHVVSKFNNLDWVGKHFAVRAFIKGKWVTRYYSLSATLVSISPQGALPPGNLNLLIKNYPPHGKMSTHMFALKKGDKFDLKGPLGPGLALTPKLDGQCIALGAGTGLMPFLDLVQIMVQQKDGDASGVYPLNILSPNLSLLLYCGFRSIKDNFAKDLLDRAVSAFKSEASPRLRIILVYDEDKAEKKLSENLIQECVVPDKVTRTWVCGPPGFNKFALDTLIRSGVDRKVIMVL